MNPKSTITKKQNKDVRKVTTKPKVKIIEVKKPFKEQHLYIAFIILALTFIAFIPSLKNDFIPTWDDESFITGNTLIRQLDIASLKEMFTTPVLGAYVPFPLLSFTIEYHFFGVDPFPYHVTNLLLHLSCTVLVFYFFRLLNLNNLYAAFGALLFGIQPMHTESVAWISERKDLLYTLFYLLSLVVYVDYVKKQCRDRKLLLLSLLLFILSLFSKIQAVSLSLSLLLVDYYFERPLKWGLILEKIPFFILSLIFGIAGIIILKREGVLGMNESYGFFKGLFLGSYALNAYVIKFFVPFHLSAMYALPIPPLHSPILLYLLSPLLLLSLTFLIYKTTRSTRAVVFGSLFFLFNILFVLQIVSAGTTYMADHYSYIPYIGLLFIVAWGTGKIVEKRKGRRYIIFPVMAFVIILFLSLTSDRCKTWANGITLWSDVIEKYPDEMHIPYNNRGATYAKLDQWDKAAKDYSKAVEIDPTFERGYSNLGDAYAKMKQWDEVITNYSKAIELKPDKKESYLDRGFAFSNEGQTDKAIADYVKAIELDPNYKEAYYNRGNVYESIQKWDKAIADYSKTIAIDQDADSAYSNRGIVYANLRQWDKAMDDFTKAIEIDKNFDLAWFNRGNIHGTLGQWDQAIADYSRAIEINSNYMAAYAFRGSIYATLGQWENAINDYTKVLEFDPGNTTIFSARENAYQQMHKSK